jgi:hypothetical protein
MVTLNYCKGCMIGCLQSGVRFWKFQLIEVTNQLNAWVIFYNGSSSKVSLLFYFLQTCMSFKVKRRIRKFVNQLANCYKGSWKKMWNQFHGIYDSPTNKTIHMQEVNDYFLISPLTEWITLLKFSKNNDKLKNDSLLI